MNYWHARDERKAVEDSGLPVVVTGYPDWTFHVRQAGAWNKYVQRAVARMTMSDKKIRDYLERAGKPGYSHTDEDAALDERMQREAFAEGCIASWSGVTDRLGNPMKLTPKNASALLAHFPDIMSALVRFAESQDHFPERPAAVIAELAAGNSEPA